MIGGVQTLPQICREPARRMEAAMWAALAREFSSSTMRRTYIHLSDLHFGQERGSDLHLHRDVRERLVDDAGKLAAKEAGGEMDGILVSGDIAFSGKEGQYLEARKWLADLTEAIGCGDENVVVVPGNHDVNRDEITAGCEALLDRILEDGEEELELYLQDPLDREVLYRRFKSYRAFAEGYACPIDTESGYAVDRRVEIGPGRYLRLIGVNSALVCSRADDEKGRLLLGARQRTFPQGCGEELVVLSHHPLDWLRDSADTSRFVRARARVFMSGHTHSPSSAVERDGKHGDIIFISAGAAVPPREETGYEYTYNKLVFDWDPESDGLLIDIEARTWSAEATRFAADVDGIRRTVVTLRCPSFEEVGLKDGEGEVSRGRGEVDGGESIDREETDLGGDIVAGQNESLRLRFFTQLTVKQRVKALADLGVVPLGEWVVDEVTHTMARHLLDSVLSEGRGEELRQAIQAAAAE